MTPEEQLKAIAIMLDVEPAEVADAVEGLLAFNDKASALVTADEIQQTDINERAENMARALLEDVDAVRQMMVTLPFTPGGFASILDTLRERVRGRLAKTPG